MRLALVVVIVLMLLVCNNGGGVGGRGNISCCCSCCSGAGAGTGDNFSATTPFQRMHPLRSNLKEDYFAGASCSGRSKRKASGRNPHGHCIKNIGNSEIVSLLLKIHGFNN